MVGESLGVGLFNNIYGAHREREARQENYYYNEMAAQNADARTRALYNDLYSPQAQLNQLKAAGLSPSLFYGDGGGIAGQTGAQGAGANGLGPSIFGLDPMSIAQTQLIDAQTQKTKAETSNIQQDTTLKELQQTWDEMRNNEKSVEFKLCTYYMVNNITGERSSLYEIADTCNSYDDFIKETESRAKNSNDEWFLNYANSEYGQKIMREIYLNSNRFERDIKVLSADGVNADFQKSIQTWLKDKGFAEKNAEVAIKQLEAAGETADLTKEQHASWNNIIERLRKKNSTMADIIIVVSMILNQAASSWVNTNVGLNNSKSEVHKVE